MKERFELVYYIAFMILGVGGLVGGIYEELFHGSLVDYLKYIGIAFLMTLARYIYNGQHFWNPPFDKPSNWKIILFVIVSSWIILMIEENLY